MRDVNLETYIYGNPCGFTVYGNVRELWDYFRKVYDNSRKGRYLYVERLQNGLTVYNYLVYGLHENAGRANSFFGMAVSINHNLYYPDFNGLIQKFDSLFNGLLKDGILFTIIKDIIRYKISKFEDNRQYIEKVKSTITSFISESELEIYDVLLSPSNNKISLLTTKLGNKTMISDLKRCTGILISVLSQTNTVIKPEFTIKPYNFNLYIFGNPGETAYEQYPNDYSVEIFKQYTIGQFGKRLVIHREWDIVYYAFVRQLTATKYIGYCIAVNGVQFIEIEKLKRLFENATKNSLHDLFFHTAFLTPHFSQNIDGFEKAKNIFYSEFSENDIKKRKFVSIFNPNKKEAIKLPFNASDALVTEIYDTSNTIILEDEDAKQIATPTDIIQETEEVLPPKNNSKKLHIIYLSIVFILLGMGIFVYVQYNQIEQKLSYSQRKVDELKSQNSDINDSLKNSQTNLTDKRREYDGLQEKFNNIQIKYDNLQTEYDNLQIEYNGLQSNYDDFKNSPNKLIETLKKDPIVILNIEIRNEGEKYNQRINHTNTTYINGKISFYSTKTKTITLEVKFYRPYSDYSFSEEVKITQYQFSIYEFGGWGGKDKGFYSPGSYRYEVWYGDKCLGVKHFTVY